MGTMINRHGNSLNFANPVPGYNKLIGRLVLNKWQYVVVCLLNFKKIILVIYTILFSQK